MLLWFEWSSLISELVWIFSGGFGKNLCNLGWLQVESSGFGWFLGVLEGSWMILQRV